MHFEASIAIGVLVVSVVLMHTRVAEWIVNQKPTISAQAKIKK